MASVFCTDAYDCAEGASALVIVTEWEQFRALDFARLKKIMERAVLVDLRNIYRPGEVARHGFVYMRASGGRETGMLQVPRDNKAIRRLASKT
jgi:UDPglucose 6-dehydrogenase